MSGDGSGDGDDPLSGKGKIIAFPAARLPIGDAKFKDLGIGKMAKQLGLSGSRLSGHWCKRCEGIWFGTVLETECPVCGNRHG